MFQKEHSAEGTVKGGTAAKDVPLRKSDRRQLCERAKAYFFFSSSPPSSCGAHQTDDDTDVDGDGDGDHEQHGDDCGDTTQRHTMLEETLDNIFLRGGMIMQRNLPSSDFPHLMSDQMTNTNRTQHQHVVLYLKEPSSNPITTTPPAAAGDGTTIDDAPITDWPYSSHHHNQFVWMALEDKKTGTVLAEAPTVALLAVIFPLVHDFTTNFAVEIPSEASKYLCRGADLMRAGMRSVPQIVVDATSNDKSMTSGGTGNNTKQKKLKNKSKSSVNTLPPMVAVCVRGNPQPFAVGRYLLSKDNIKNIGVGSKGVGVEIWNCYGDDLWRLCCPGSQELLQLEKNGQLKRNIHGQIRDVIVDHSSGTMQAQSKDDVNRASQALPYDNGHFGNVGFMNGKQVVSLIRVHRVGGGLDGDASDDEDTVDENDGRDDDECAEDPNIASNDPETPNLESNNEESTAPSNEQDINAGAGDERHKSDPGDGEEDTQEKEEISPDRILHQAVCQALVNLSNKDLPMLVSTFYSQHVVPNRPTGSTLELKKTSWKKFGNYLKDKMAEGLLHAGPDPSNRNKKGADPIASLVSFDKRHPELQRYSKSSTAANGTTNSGKPSKIVLVNLYLIPPKWITLLRLNDDDVKATNATSEERKGTGMLTLPEVRAIIDNYIDREDLVSKESNKKGYIVLDGPLTDVLFKNNNKSDSDNADYPTHISRKDFAKLIPTKLSPAFALVSMPGSKIVQLAKGSPPRIEIDVSQRQSKKFVTRLRGLERYLIDPAYFAKDVSKRIAVPATIDSDPTASGRAALRQKNDVELVFGGNVVDELEAILCGDEALSSHGGVKNSEYSIPQSVIDVTLRKGVPARKKTAGGFKSKKK